MKTNNRFTGRLYWAIAVFSMSCSMAIAILEISFPLQSVSASPEYAIATKQKQAKPKVVRIAGNYKTVFTPEFLAKTKKQV